MTELENKPNSKQILPKLPRTHSHLTLEKTAKVRWIVKGEAISNLCACQVRVGKEPFRFQHNLLTDKLPWRLTRHGLDRFVQVADGDIKLVGIGLHRLFGYELVGPRAA